MSHLARICRLIDNSLRPYTESAVISISKQQEKALIINLSQILKEIQLLPNQLDCDSDNETDEETCIINGGSSRGSESHFEDPHCLTKVVADLIILLRVESQYVQHLTGNVLVALSEFVAASGSIWGTLICMLYVCLELVMSNILSYSLAPSNTRKWEPEHDLSSFTIVMKTRLKDANWFPAVAVVRVLRNIWKSLKRDWDDQLAEVYLDSVCIFLSNVPWDMLNEIHVGQGGDAQTFSNDVLLLRNAPLPDMSTLFLGNLLQLFCSLAEGNGLVEADEGSLAKNQVISKISSLVPQLMCWCLGFGVASGNRCIHQYFRHKLLMLIFRISSQICLEHPVLLSWLQLLHKHFEDLLRQPINDLITVGDDYLEGSPFSSSIYDGEINIVCSRHLQRLAVFIFLRCVFNLISLKGNTYKKCDCATLRQCFDLSSDVKCCGVEIGLSELHEWLLVQLPCDVVEDYNSYIEKCISFTSSFLQLYMHEDDILFEMLLQLFRMPSHAEKKLHEEVWSLGEMKMHVLLHLSNIFNPLQLFHLFLAKLHYDHQILLDYLISKATGISCAEYLLRCLLTVCDSWNSFVVLSEDGKNLSHLSCKRRKVALDGPDCQVDYSSKLEKGDAVAFQLEKIFRRDNQYGNGAKRLLFEHAKECLLSLKTSIESLHQKGLFPYNPAALLKRLRRFQELCLREEIQFLKIRGPG